MTDFKAKMHLIRFRLGLRRPRWGSLQRSPRPPSWIWGALLLRRGEGREGKETKGEGRGRKGPWAPHYLEEVYAYVSGAVSINFWRPLIYRQWRRRERDSSIPCGISTGNFSKFSWEMVHYWNSLEERSEALISHWTLKVFGHLKNIWAS